MNYSKLPRLLAMVLSILIILCMIPVTALATESDTSLTIASTKTSALAPGVKEDEIVAYDTNGDRIVYYVINADMATNPDVMVKANYHDNDNTGIWGKATVVEQANAATAKRGYNVVATTNAAYYNVSTGQPTGAFVMEGVNLNGNSQGDNHPFFAIMKDGTAMIGKTGTWSQYADNVQEAVGGWTLLVWDGVIQNVNKVNKYPRSTVGVKANGDVVLMVADGNQKPMSAGLTLYEQAEVMKSLGCEYAIELDGGGSATYAAKLEGTDEVVVRSVPCDGTTRSVSNSIMVISTAVADGTFDHANLSTSYAFYAPHSNVQIDAIGADRAGKPADIPSTVTWAIEDTSFGSVNNGVFTSNGKLGTVAVQMLNEGTVVGSVDVTIINPDEFAFAAEEKTVPYGKTSDFSITSMYNGAEVFAAADAFDFACTAGEMNGFIFTAPTDETVACATVTATYKYAQLNSATVTAKFGKGSEILFDFEDADISDWKNYFGLVEAAENGEYTGGYVENYGEKSPSGNYVQDGIKENVFLASKQNGSPVYNGDYSLGFTLDYTQATGHANWMYSYLYNIGDVLTYRDVENGINGTRFGMWMYIPEEAVGLCARMCYTYKQANGTLNTAYLYFTYQYVEKGFSKLTSEKIPESGWAYVYCDLDKISDSYVTSAYYKTADGNYTRDPATNYAPAFIQFIVSSSASGAEKCTLYIDDITLDYSDVVDDRDAPIISNPLILDDQSNYKIDGSTINFNKFSVTADVAEDTSHGTNFTGLDAQTAQIYVDGHKVATSYSAGKISANGIVLPNGTHDISFEIADKQGNYTKLTRQTVVNTTTDYATIELIGEAPAVNKDGNLYTGSQYNLLLKTDKVNAIDTVTTKIWLNSASKWALEHMTALEGFEASYSLDELACTAEITVKRTGDVKLTGEATLVTIPVYAWSWDGSAGHDAHTQWASKGCAPQIDISYKVKFGDVKYTDAFAVNEIGYIAGFSNKRQDVDTELNSSIANLKNSIGEWHYHSEVAVSDLAATCTADGFTGRTQCSVCKSILNWGEIKEATDHTYALTDGLLKCACGKLFNGVFTDGSTYIDGLVANGWTANDEYYINGTKCVGIVVIDDFYYNFDKNGVCANKTKYTGLINDNDGVKYSVVGSLVSQWQYIDGKYYYFSPETNCAIKDGEHVIDGANYKFEDYALVRGHLYKTSKGIRYRWAGKTVYREWCTIDGRRYYFDRYSYAQVGVARIEEGTYSGVFKKYLFNDDGQLMDDLDGLREYNNSVYYVVNGELKYKGLVKYNNYYYYIGSSLEPVKNCTYNVSQTNGLLPKGEYLFDEYGRIVFKQGLHFDDDGEIRFYVDGKPTYAGLVQDAEGYFYYISGSTLRAIKNSTRYVSFTNDLVPAGTYTFGADGRMTNPPKQGLHFDDDGEIRFYVDGKPTYAGLVQDAEGYFYYISGSTYRAVKNSTRYISFTNDLVPAGTYTFGADGRMTNPPKQGLHFDDDGEIRFYVDGKPTYAGLVQDAEGYFYYISGSTYRAVKNSTRYISFTNDLIPAGTYTFGADGKMTTKVGVVLDDDGEIRYYEAGKAIYAGLVKDNDGNFYYISGSTLRAVKNSTRYVSFTNDLLPAGTYTFGADGKMIIK